MILPTVGRDLWYRPNSYDKTGPEAMQQHWDAPLCSKVVCVHSDRLVNLVIFDEVGTVFTRLSVPLRQEGDVLPEGVAFAEWMPFQVKAAAKWAEQDAQVPQVPKDVSYTAIARAAVSPTQE